MLVTAIALAVVAVPKPLIVIASENSAFQWKGLTKTNTLFLLRHSHYLL